MLGNLVGIQSANKLGISENGMGQTGTIQAGMIPYIIFAAAVVVLLILITVLVIYLIRKKKAMTEIEEEQVVTEIPGMEGSTGIKVEPATAERPIAIGSVHGIGRRSYQQDSFGISDINDAAHFRQKGLMAVVADGMGGLSDGDKISQCVVISMLKGFEENSDNLPEPSLLFKLLNDSNESVNNLLASMGGGRSGSTLTAVIVKDRKLSWISVGDSHIYVYREGKLVKVNKDHNYAAELDEQVSRGMITVEEAMSDPQRAALTSYIGMGNLEHVDQNEKSVFLEKGDRILLMSDGVYGTVGDDRLCELMGYKLRQSCIMIENEIRQYNKDNQDNYTCVILEITE